MFSAELWKCPNLGHDPLANNLHEEKILIQEVKKRSSVDTQYYGLESNKYYMESGADTGGGRRCPHGALREGPEGGAK